MSRPKKIESGTRLVIYDTDGQEADSGSYSQSGQLITERYSPEAIGAMHRSSDLDSSQFAQHHTLGPRHNQSAPGDHSHDGANSKAIFHVFSGSVTTNGSGLVVIDTGASFGTISAAFVMYDQTLRTGGPFCSAIYYDVWTSTNHHIGTQWMSGSSTLNSTVVYYRGVVFP